MLCIYNARRPFVFFCACRIERHAPFTLSFSISLAKTFSFVSCAPCAPWLQELKARIEQETGERLPTGPDEKLPPLAVRTKNAGKPAGGGREWAGQQQPNRTTAQPRTEG